jgi:hypothetical protein
MAPGVLIGVLMVPGIGVVGNFEYQHRKSALFTFDVRKGERRRRKKKKKYNRNQPRWLRMTGLAHLKLLLF